MKLPNLENALIDDRKIIDYLLSDEKSGGKSAFFSAIGFSAADPQIMRHALLVHAQNHPIIHRSETTHGIKFIVDGELHAPDGRSPRIRTVWIIETGADHPRLVTAYPL